MPDYETFEHDVLVIGAGGVVCVQRLKRPGPACASGWFVNLC